jgi:beta-lactamase class A
MANQPRGIDRRSWLAGALGVGLGIGCAQAAPGATRSKGPPAPRSQAVEALASLERKHGGRLGVATLDTESGARIEHRAGERFPFCSTCKTLAVAATLHRVDLGKERLDRSVTYSAADLLEHAPVAKATIERGALTIDELCKAAITVSDNTAANLLFREAGGLGAFNDYVRTLGDKTTRFDRTEPGLNTAIEGDPRDTTSPRAIVDDLQKLFLGDALVPGARDQLIAWHLATTTGPARLRAGLPAAWKLGHKTGTGQRGATNDIGVAWPPDRKPLLIAVYYVGSTAETEAREAVIAAAARIIAARD